jgi:hypothetical protein
MRQLQSLHGKGAQEARVAGRLPGARNPVSVQTPVASATTLGVVFALGSAVSARVVAANSRTS